MSEEINLRAPWPYINVLQIDKTIFIKKDWENKKAIITGYGLYHVQYITEKGIHKCKAILRYKDGSEELAYKIYANFFCPLCSFPRQTL